MVLETSWWTPGGWWSPSPRGGRRPAHLDRPPLAALAGPRPVSRSSVAELPAAQRAHPEGVDVRAHRGGRGGRDDVAAGDPRRGAELGLPLYLDPRHRGDPVGAVRAPLRPGSPRPLPLR